MYRHRNVVSKSEVVKHVDSAEKDDVGHPYDQRYCSWFEKKRWMRSGKVRWPCQDRNKEELAEGDEET